MTLQHVPQIAQLEKRCFCDPWSESSVQAELENPLSIWLVALEDNNVIGYVGAQSVPPESDVMNLAVAPASRKRGIAKALMSELLLVLQGSGICTVSLEVRASNLPACTLYQALGFQIVGRRPNYYHNPKEDALIMRKEL